MVALKARLKKAEAALGGGDVDHETWVALFNGHISQEEFDRQYRPAERRAFVEREAAARGMTWKELDTEMGDHFFNPGYPRLIWTNGKLGWSSPMPHERRAS